MQRVIDLLHRDRAMRHIHQRVAPSHRQETDFRDHPVFGLLEVGRDL